MVIIVQVTKYFSRSFLKLNFQVGIYILAHGFWKTWILFEQKKTKWWNEWHFVQNKTQIMQHVLKV
jgi:hypothetical protein